MGDIVCNDSDFRDFRTGAAGVDWYSDKEKRDNSHCVQVQC